MPLGFVINPLNAEGHKALRFRIKNHDVHGGLDNMGWYFEANLTLSDTQALSATVDVRSYLPANGIHPQSVATAPSVPLKQQRFMDVVIPLEDFLQVEPNLDLNSLGMLDWDFTTDGSAPFDIRFGLDDLRLE